MKILPIGVLCLMTSLCSCHLLTPEESVKKKTIQAIGLSEPVNVSEAKELLSSCKDLAKDDVDSCERQVAGVCLQKILRSKTSVEKNDLLGFMEHKEIARLTSPQGDNMILKAAIIGERSVDVMKLLIENGNDPKTCRYIDRDGAKICSICLAVELGNKEALEFFCKEYPELLDLKCGQKKYSPEQLASKSDHPELVEMIKKYKQ